MNMVWKVNTLRCKGNWIRLYNNKWKLSICIQDNKKPNGQYRKSILKKRRQVWEILQDIRTEGSKLQTESQIWLAPCFSKSCGLNMVFTDEYLQTINVKNQLIWKDSDAGQDWRQEEKRTTEDEMVGWHHQLNGHEFE